MLDRMMIAIENAVPDVDLLREMIRNLPVRYVMLVHCVETTGLARQPHSGAVWWTRRSLERAARELDTDLEDCKVEAMTLRGIPAHQIVRAATDHAIDTILMRTFIVAPWETAFIGSTPLQIITYGTTDMLVLHMREDETQHGGLPHPLLKHVLFATDFSDYARANFDRFVTLGERGMQKVTLLHVQDTSIIRPHLMERLSEFDVTDTRRLEAMVKALKEHGVEADYRVQLGIPEETITEIANIIDASCVVIGARGKSPSAELKWGSVSERVTY